MEHAFQKGSLSNVFWKEEGAGRIQWQKGQKDRGEERAKSLTWLRL
jgi:hypothetical protein